MSIRKTLGGDRLGSGNKMQVDLHGYERSTQDLGYIWRSTMSAGTLVPCISEVALPGDTFDIDLGCIINTHPTVGPLFGSYKVQIDVFQAPIRLYNSLLHNNALGIGMKMSKVKFPVLELTATELPAGTKDLDNAQINPSCILSYLGIRGAGHPKGAVRPSRYFNGIPFLAYWEIYKQYYANKMEEVGAVIHTGTTANVETVTSIVTNSQTIAKAPGTVNQPIVPGQVITVNYTGAKPLSEQIFFETTIGKLPLNDLADLTSDTGTVMTFTARGIVGSYIVNRWNYRTSTDLPVGKPNVVLFDLDNIDTMKKQILAYNSETAPFDIKQTGLTPYVWVLQGNESNNATYTQEGLAIKTYQSDLFNNWLQTEWFDGTDGINQITAIDTSGGSFTLDTLNLSKKVYDMLNRIAVSGGTYDDWLDVQYDHPRYTRAESPIYCGGLIKELVFQEVVSTASAAPLDGTQPLGTLAGRGVMSGKHKGGKITIKVDEPSYIIGIISLTPRIDYSQGNKWDVHLQTMDDLHKPALDEIGFQELITEQMAWWDTEWDGTKWVQKSAGKQPAWINYMTNVNQVRGNFAIANNEMFMTLNRRYEHDTTTSTIKDLTTYIDPSKFNHIFAETSLDAQNFWVQVAVDITARRKMSAKVMPNL